MNDYPVNRKNKLVVLVVGIVLGVVAAAILIPPLVVRFRGLSGQARGKHAHRDGVAASQ